MRKQYTHLLLGILIAQSILSVIFMVVFSLSSFVLTVLSTEILEDSDFKNIVLMILSIGNSIISILVFRFVIFKLLPKTTIKIKQFVLLCSVYFTSLTSIFCLLYLLPILAEEQLLFNTLLSFSIFLLQPSLYFFDFHELLLPIISDNFKLEMIVAITVVLIESSLKVIALGIGYSKLLNETAFENSIKNNETKAQTDNTKLLNNDLETKNNIPISND